MIQSSDELIQEAIMLLHAHYKKQDIKTLRRKNKILIFLDPDNFVEIEPRTICINCEKDMEQKQQLKEMSHEAI